MRMLCSRSASLMSTTRMSSAIARNIFRMFSACCCSWLWVLNFESLVTPSTRWATSGPNRSSTSARLYSVSSGTSWRSAAATATGSMPSSARIWAEAIGWVTYGSPEARTCAAWASTARSNARSTDREVGLRVVRAGARRAASRPERVEVPAPAALRARCRRPRRRGAGRGGRGARACRAAPRAAPRDRGRRARPCESESTRVPFERRRAPSAVSRGGRSRGRRSAAGRPLGDARARR